MLKLQNVASDERARRAPLTVHAARLCGCVKWSLNQLELFVCNAVIMKLHLISSYFVIICSAQKLKLTAKDGPFGIFDRSCKNPPELRSVQRNTR